MRGQAERFRRRIVTRDAVDVRLCGDVKTVTDGAGAVWKAVR